MGRQFSEAETRYFELRGRLASGRLSPEAFAAAVDDLLVRGPDGRFWSLDPETGRWQVHDGSHWVDALPPTESMAPAGPRPRLDYRLVAPALLVLAAVGLWLVRPAGPTAPAAPSPVLAGAPGPATAADPATSAAGGGVEAADRASAASLVQEFVARYRAAPTYGEAFDAIRPMLTSEARLQPNLVGQAFQLPARRNLRPVDARLGDPVERGAGVLWYPVEIDYAAADGSEAATLRWGLVLVPLPERGAWGIRYILLADEIKS